MWCVAEIDDEYIARMEDVLATYERPLSYKEPVVCLDEKPIQLLKTINSTSRLTRRGKPRRKDYEYERKGTANAFCVIEPKRGRHMVKITKNRNADQFAAVMRDIGRAYPAATKIHLVDGAIDSKVVFLAGINNAKAFTYFIIDSHLNREFLGGKVEPVAPGTLRRSPGL